KWDDIVETLTKRYNNYRKAVDQYNSEDVFQQFMNAYTESIDPHTNYFSPKFGVLANPVTITVEDSHVSEVSCPDQEIANELMAYLKSTANGQRAGEFAIGTNTAVKRLTGNLLQDEKIPGIHVAFGNPSSHKTGADWESDVHVDVVPVECTIRVDGKTIMEDGKFLDEVLREE
ncbi:MAG: hypothetical protein P8Y37_12200, partial [Anaerolineales bacterium]